MNMEMIGCGCLVLAAILTAAGVKLRALSRAPWSKNVLRHRMLAMVMDNAEWRRAHAEHETHVTNGTR